MFYIYFINSNNLVVELEYYHAFHAHAHAYRLAEVFNMKVYYNDGIYVVVD